MKKQKHLIIGLVVLVLIVIVAIVLILTGGSDAAKADQAQIQTGVQYLQQLEAQSTEAVEAELKEIRRQERLEALENGEIIMCGKARGSKNANNLLASLIAKDGIDFSKPCYLAYSGLNDTLLQKYVADSAHLYEGRAADFPVVSIGSTIGTHAGPGAIAVAFFAKN